METLKVIDHVPATGIEMWARVNGSGRCRLQQVGLKFYGKKPLVLPRGLNVITRVIEDRGQNKLVVVEKVPGDHGKKETATTILLSAPTTVSLLYESPYYPERGFCLVI